MLGQKWFDSIGQSKLLELFITDCVLVNLRIKLFKLLIFIGWHWVDYLVIVEDRDFWIIAFDEAYCWKVIRAQSHISWAIVIHVRECNFVLGSDLMSDYDLVDIVKLVPVFIFFVDVPIKGFKLGSSRNSHVQGFRSVKTLLVEKMEVIFVG